MRRTVGVLVMEHIAVGLVEGHKVLGPPNIFPEKVDSLDPLQSMPAEGIVDCIRRASGKSRGRRKNRSHWNRLSRNHSQRRRGGFTQPPSSQGISIASGLSSALSGRAAGAQVRLFNDADVMAAGIAAAQGKLHELTRVWTLGMAWGLAAILRAKESGKAGTPVVTLDPRRISAAAAAADIWKEFSDAAPCVCASWISNRKKF